MSTYPVTALFAPSLVRLMRSRNTFPSSILNAVCMSARNGRYDWMATVPFVNWVVPRYVSSPFQPDTLRLRPTVLQGVVCSSYVNCPLCAVTDRTVVANRFGPFGPLDSGV